MKKYIFNLALLAMGMMAATSCSPDYEGTEPGGDSQPKATLYQYTPTTADGDYDSDTDIRVRIVANDKTDQVYYKAMKTTEREAMSETQAIDNVVSTGTSISKPGAGSDVYVTGMQGAYTICAVAVSGSTKTLSETTFYGITWTDVCEGQVRTKYATGTSSYGYVQNIMLQHNEDYPQYYRLKNLYGKGYHLPIEMGEANEAVKGTHFIYIAKTALPYTYGSYGTISVSDYTTYSGSDYTEYCTMYDDFSYLEAYCAYTVSAGRITAGWVEFYPYGD